MHPIYRKLLEEVDDAFQRCVLEVLLDRAGETVTRRQFVATVSGEIISSRVATADRKIRLAIAALRAANWPILSSSGEAGYRLCYDEFEIAICAAEMRRRAESQAEAARVMGRSVDKARRIAEAVRADELYRQERMSL